jgi:TonB family protein
MVVSLVVHAALAVVAVSVANRQPAPTASPDRTADADHFVFLDLPAPSGGGGGGGTMTVVPASVVRVTGQDSVTTPAPPPALQADTATPPPLNPPPTASLPISPTAADVLSSVGAVSAVMGLPSRGAGAGSGADGGKGSGTGGGDGRGVGPGLQDGTGGGVFQMGAGIDSPERIREVKPTYTSGAMQAKIQGVVWVEATVLASGKVVDPVVVRSLDRVHGLDGQAIQAVLATPFKPGRKDGRPVAVRVTFELTFALR